MPITVYVCEHCGRPWPSRMDARWCEIQHEHNDRKLIKQEQFLNDIKKNHSDPCRYCGRSYYVYGIEMNCECSKNCKNYSLFSLKEEV